SRRSGGAVAGTETRARGTPAARPVRSGRHGSERILPTARCATAGTASGTAGGADDPSPPAGGEPRREPGALLAPVSPQERARLPRTPETRGLAGDERRLGIADDGRAEEGERLDRGRDVRLREVRRRRAPRGGDVPPP